jgi:hypothetical protein
LSCLRFEIWSFLCLVAMAAAGCDGEIGDREPRASAAKTTSSVATPGITWRPSMVTSWQVQLAGVLDQSVDAHLFEVDLFDTAASTVAALHAQGRKVVCYLSAGTLESWRPDAAAVPESIKGKAVEGWPNERWLDVRSGTLRPILEARLDLCRAKGFDGIDADNVNGYQNDTGFALGAADQIAFNRWLAAGAHARGLSIGLKNDLPQVTSLVDDFDWAVNEGCFVYRECALLAPFIAAGKSVLNIEYTAPANAFCTQANALGLNSLLKNRDLGAYRVACR